MRILISCTAIFLVFTACGSTSNRPEDSGTPADYGFVFPQDSVPHIKLTPVDGFGTIEKEYLEAGYKEYWKASFDFNGEVLDVVGLRLKGSVKDGKGKEEIKYALKLNFDFFDGERFRGVDKVHLENNKPDPSRMRERLATRLYAAMGVPVARTAFVNVEIFMKPGNEEPDNFGLYTMIQAVDKRFLKDHFGTLDHADDGNLYSCEAPGCTLEWKGDSKWDYHFPDCGGSEECGLTLITNEKSPDVNTYEDLIDFLDLLNNTPDAEFEAAISGAFEVDLFLRWLAVAVTIADYESYLGDADAFYLYNRPDTGKFVFIPWDLNKTYGDKKCNGSVEETGGRIEPPWCLGPGKPLVERIYAVPAFKAQYLTYVEQVLTDHFTDTVQALWVKEYGELIYDDFIEEDVSFHSEDDYWVGIGEDESDERPLNLLDFVKRRRAYLMSELASM